MSDKFVDLIFRVGIFSLVCVTLMVVMQGRKELSHHFLGSRGGPCFANNTCRENLVCLHGEGAEPGTCAAKAAGR